MFAGPVAIHSSFPNNFLGEKFNDYGHPPSNCREAQQFIMSKQTELKLNLQSLNTAVDFVGKLSFNDLNSMDYNGNTKLIIACAQGDLEMTTALIEQGAFVNQQNFKGQTALYWAVTVGDISLVDILLENGANPNISDVEGASPLHIACANGNINVVYRLVKSGAFFEYTG